MKYKAPFCPLIKGECVRECVAFQLRTRARIRRPIKNEDDVDSVFFILKTGYYCREYEEFVEVWNTRDVTIHDFNNDADLFWDGADDEKLFYHLTMIWYERQNRMNKHYSRM